jgi:hypothetical protein
LILDRFLGHLETRDFSGFSDLSSDLYTFVLFFLEGKALLGFRIIEDRFYVFSSLYQRIEHLELTQLVFYQTPPSFIRTVADVVFSTPLYEGLSTTFTFLPPLLKDLEADTFTGTVHIQWADAEGFIRLHHGIPETVFLITSAELSEGKHALEEILDKVKKEEGTISVYRRTEKAADREELGRKVVNLTATGIHEEIRSQFSQLGVEFLEAASEKVPLGEIAHDLCVDLFELEPLCVYLVERGYATLKKRDVVEEKTRKFWNNL